jgi:hypothetical protein
MVARGASLGLRATVGPEAAGASGVCAAALAMEKRTAEEIAASLNLNFIGSFPERRLERDGASNGSGGRRNRHFYIQPVLPTGAAGDGLCQKLRRGSHHDAVDRHAMRCGGIRPRHGHVHLGRRRTSRTVNLQYEPCGNYERSRSLLAALARRRSSPEIRDAAQIEGRIARSLAADHRASGRRKDRDSGCRRDGYRWRNGSRGARRLPGCRECHQRRQHPYRE